MKSMATARVAGEQFLKSIDIFVISTKTEASKFLKWSDLEINGDQDST